jgi:hypothetical protein
MLSTYLKFLGVSNADHHMRYGSDVNKFKSSFCAFIPNNSVSFTMGIYQQTHYGNQRRFISIDAKPDRILLSITPIGTYSDYYFKDSYVLPSDSFPDMLKGGERYRYFGYRDIVDVQESLEDKISYWRTKKCLEKYELVGVADKLLHLLEAISDSKRSSQLRVLLFHDKPLVVFMGFNKQSLTIKLNDKIDTSYLVDEISLWRQPRPPRRRDEIDFKQEKKFDSSWTQDNIVFWSSQIQVFFTLSGFLSRGVTYGLQKFYAFRENPRAKTVTLTGTPQIAPQFKYMYWLGFTTEFPGRFHADLQGIKFHHRTILYIGNEPDGEIYTGKFSTERRGGNLYQIDRLIGIWDSYVGRICVRSGKEEYFVGPDFQLIGFEGNNIPSRVIEREKIIFIEGCDYVK